MEVGMIFLFRASRRLAHAIPVCLTLAAAPTAGTGQELFAWREADSMQMLVEHLERWLDVNTELPRRVAPPAVLLTGLAHAASISQNLSAEGEPTRRGLYDPDSATVWLVRPWDPRNPYDTSTLLHELVHHRQAEAGYWRCPGAQELPAYRAQQAWLNELGLEPNVNWIAVVLESGCTPRDIHPD
jgi:Domain of unknown function (DUF6647)